MRRRVLISLLGAALIGVAALNACTPQRSALEQVLDSGELRVYTRNSATTYYHGPHGPTGLEYQLAKGFAERLGVRLKLIVEDNPENIYEGLRKGRADLAAAGLTVTDLRRQQVRFAPAYQSITQELIYRDSGQPAPKDFATVSQGHLEVVANSSHAERLRQLQQDHPELEWYENQEAGSTELLTLVAQNVIDYTIADSNQVAINRRYFPELKVAFDISKPQELAWAMPRSEDTSLYAEVKHFFNDIRESGELAKLLKQNYEYVRNYDYAGTPYFMHHMRSRMPLYRQQFELAAEQTNLDWRLLAAVAYQESHWNPLAVSPTGVRGIMMLTNMTAEHLGVDDRTDPDESIQGGARYIRSLYERFDDIPQEDRMWFALAAYNVGIGHMRDVQWITKQRGGNPKKWADVKANLPLLRQQKWYSKTRYGYARGNEPVTYVSNIRSYYDILRWHIRLKQHGPVPTSILAYSSPAL
jgi:membrane-bound lytic murein transglycosylase F